MKLMHVFHLCAHMQFQIQLQTFMNLAPDVSRTDEASGNRHWINQRHVTDV